MPLSSFRWTALATGSLMTLTLVGAGCGSATTTETNNSLNLPTGSGNTLSAGDNAQIPSDLPNDFPQYAGAKTTLAYTENNGTSGSLVQETTDTFANVRATIEQRMQSQGFTKETGVDSPGFVILSFTKGNVRYQINLTQNGEKTQIQSVRSQQ